MCWLQLAYLLILASYRLREWWARVVSTVECSGRCVRCRFFVRRVRSDSIGRGVRHYRRSLLPGSSVSGPCAFSASSRAFLPRWACYPPFFGPVAVLWSATIVRYAVGCGVSGWHVTPSPLLATYSGVAYPAVWGSFARFARFLCIQVRYCFCVCSGACFNRAGVGGSPAATASATCAVGVAAPAVRAANFAADAILG